MARLYKQTSREKLLAQPVTGQGLVLTRRAHWTHRPTLIATIPAYATISGIEIEMVREVPNSHRIRLVVTDTTRVEETTTIAVASGRQEEAIAV